MLPASTRRSGLSENFRREDVLRSGVLQATLRSSAFAPWVCFARRESPKQRPVFDILLSEAAAQYAEGRDFALPTASASLGVLPIAPTSWSRPQASSGLRKCRAQA